MKAIRPVLLIVCAAAALSAAPFIPLPIIRAAVALPIACLLPGYAIVAAILGRWPWLDDVPVLGLSAIVSLAVYPLLGVTLSAFHVALSTASFILSADLVVVLCTVVAVLRGISTRDRFTFHMRLNAGPVLVIASLIGVAAVLLDVVERGLPQAVPTAYTQFYLSAGKSNMPELTGSRQATVAIALGVSNHTQHRQDYAIVSRVDSGKDVVGASFLVPAGATWQGSVEEVVPHDKATHRLGVTLHNGGRVVGTLTVWAARGSLTRSCRLTVNCVTNP